MKKKTCCFSVSLFLPLGFALILVIPSPAASQSAQPIVIHELRHDISPPLRDIAAGAPLTAVPHEALPVRHRPTALPGEVATGGEPDAAVQSSPGPQVSTTNLLNFDGISADGVAPPDTNGSVGATQFVQIVNTEYAVYDKGTGALLLGPLAIHTIWSGFGGLCSTSDGGDPIVLYDKAAGRWLVSQLNFNSSFTSNLVCIAISTSSDATGTFFRYSFSFGTNLTDYPKFGVWTDAYYFSANIFASGLFFTGPEACAFNRTDMLIGNPGTAICFQRGTSDFGLLPSDLDGSTPPGAGEPDFYLEFVAPSTLNLFKFHVDFVTPTNSTFTGPTVLTVKSFTEACGNGGTCITQTGTTQRLDSLGDRLMYRLAFRNLATHESLVVNDSVKAGNITTGTRTGVRWYEIQNPNGTPVVAQQATFSPDTTHRWMGSMGMDKLGDIAVGYSASSSTIHPAIRFTGRLSTDAVNTLETEATIKAGGGSQTGGLTRWGDYSSISIDPNDDCTFWYTTEYLTTNGSFNWHTRIASFKFTTCM